MAHDPRFVTNAARVANREPLDVIIGAWVAARTYAEVESGLVTVSVPVSKILSIEDCVHDPHYAFRRSIIEVPELDGTTTLRPNIFPVFRWSGSPVVAWAGPKLGAHNRVVYEDLLGLSGEDLAELSRQHVI